MEQTYKYKIRTVDDVELFDKILYDYTGLFFKLFNNLELSEDKGFIEECLEKFGVDKTIYDYCLVDVKMSESSSEQIKKDKQKELEDIKKQLDALYKIKHLTRKQKAYKKEIIQRRQITIKNVDKGVCFGTKALLRQITKIQQKETKTKKDVARLKKFKKEFAKKRKRNIFLWGKAIDGGNRKVDFFLEEDYMILKMDKNTKVRIDIIPFECKNRKKTTKKLIKYLKSNNVALTVRISKTMVCMTFDNEVINGFGFDTTGFNKAVEENVDESRTKKDIRIEFYKEQLDRKLKDKIKIRAAGLDPNPKLLGFSIVDVDEKTQEITKVVFHKTFNFEKYVDKNDLSVEEKKKLNRKFKYELLKAIQYIARECEHFKVGYFGIEDLNKMSKKIADKGREFNRQTKNAWNKQLIFEAIMMKCGELGIICEDIPPQFTSFIGNIKNEIYDPAAASTETARRAIIKYKKSAKLFPDITEKDHEKLTYLLGEDSMKYKSWVSLYKRFKNSKDEFSGDKWRNKNFTVDRYLCSQKSNVTICS